MRPALYLELDLGLKASAEEALDWSFRAGIVAEGTFLG